jgi:hypothetical protein
MFHLFFFHTRILSCNTPNTITDAMCLVSAYKVEQDLQAARREQTEQQLQSDCERISARQIAEI